MRSLKASDVMWNHIEPIRCGTPLTRVVETLLQNHVTGLPVVDAKRHVLGFVSEQDCIHSLLVTSYHSEGEPVVDDVMTKSPVTISPEEAVVDLAQRLERDKPKVYPVVEGGRLLGIVTRTAILAALAKVRDGTQASRSTPQD
ncbi:CBS domain-containing protein [Marinobacter fonticola]|uniref:CBS domain-containing protein n=1 Tax=Marinobacter fonticola TaxID=2603215 RepID=UPI0011E84DD3|nr:CBS domain-containing protein [Marinobacter fonticola]